MLYAIAIYKINAGKLEIVNCAVKNQGGLFPYRPLKSLEEKTLPELHQQGMAHAKIYHVVVGNEHHYLLHTANDHIRAIVSRKQLDQTECFYLFHNSQYAPLIDILNNPLGYTGRDVSRDKLHKNLDDLKNQLLEVVDHTLQRREKLDRLTEKAFQLKRATDEFDEETKKLNGCCTYF